MRWRRAHVAPECQRMLRAARYLYGGGTVTSDWLNREFGISKRHASRDMSLMRCYLPVWIERGARGQVKLTIRRGRMQ